MITIDTSNLDFDEYSSNSIYIVNSNIVFKTSGLNKMTVFNNGDIDITGDYKNTSGYIMRNASNYVLSTCNILVERMRTSSILINTFNTSHFSNNVVSSKIDILNPNLWNTCNINWLHFNGSVAIARAAIGSAAIKLHVGGEIACDGDISAYYSDERLKTKISNINSPLEIINGLNGFYYIPNSLAHINGITNTKQEVGLSAQDVQKVLPEIVKIAPFDLAIDNEGEKISKSGSNYLTISYERLVPVLVEAIKKLNNDIILINEKYEKILEDIALIKAPLNLI